MADTQAILDSIDQRLTQQWSKIADGQESYHADKGRYFQGLPLHSRRPVDGEEITPDRLSVRPTDQAESWSDAASRYGIDLPAKLMSLLRIDTYGGPLGEGYIVTAEAEINGKLWRKRVNVGPETHRDAAWHRPAEDETA